MTEEEKKIKDLIEKYRCGLIDSEECISKCHFVLIDKAKSAKLKLCTNKNPEFKGDLIALF